MAFRAPTISIHALLAESDQADFGLSDSDRRISIHALLAESDATDAINGCNPDYISIHALLAESDFRQNYECFKWIKFLSTLSLRRATEKVPADVYYQSFLSTLSLRRAT